MKEYNFFFSSKLALLYLFIWSLCFHSHILLTKQFLFYRELISFLFLILSIWYLVKFKLWSELFKKEILILLIPYSIFIIIIILNPGDLDPEYVKSSRVLTSELNDEILISYIIRNFILFVPILLFFFMKGLSENEIQIILKIYFVLGILNLYIFLNNSLETHNTSILEFLIYNNIYSENNNHTPLISGLFAIGTYLSIKEKNNYLFILFSLLSSFYFYLIFLSSGKAAIIFSILSLIFFMIVFFKNKIKLFTFLFILVSTFYIFHLSFSSYIEINKEKLNLEGAQFKNCPWEFERCLERRPRLLTENEFIYPIFDKDLERLNLNPRIEIYKEFFNSNTTVIKENKKEFWFGNGSLSMMFSGLHNDYMRIYFRTGILGLIFSFIPIFYFFFIFFIFSYQQYFYKKRTDIIYLLFILLTFIPYYSLFAYPRESTYQSGTFWLSMFLVYGYLSNNYKKYE
ncbi:O-antigen ligase family protein [Candidatus Pelagibacter sp.]|nr:O-antigen ligase family protein [Candidatus Pelagibacter sp.]